MNYETIYAVPLKIIHLADDLLGLYLVIPEPERDEAVFLGGQD
jgi:hypothetical protein